MTQVHIQIVFGFNRHWIKDTNYTRWFFTERCVELNLRMGLEFASGMIAKQTDLAQSPQGMKLTESLNKLCQPDLCFEYEAEIYEYFKWRRRKQVEDFV